MRDNSIIIDGPTLVVGDLHLRSTSLPEDAWLFDWIAERCSERQVTNLVMVGDTFELSFCENDGRSFRHELSAILALNIDHFKELVRRTKVNRLVFLTGDHDFRLPDMGDLVQGSLQSFVRTHIAEIAYHRGSAALLLHGHQFDMNRTSAFRDSEPLTERLGDAFDRFIYDGSPKGRIFDRACVKGVFSFWYSEGTLPEYIAALERCFGYDGELFWESCSDNLLKTPGKLKHGLFRLMSRVPVIRSLTSKLPRWLVLLGCLWTVVCGKMISDTRFGRVKNLVIGHLHRPISMDIAGCRKVCAVASPRVHVSGLVGGEVILNRRGAVAYLEKDALLFRVTSYINDMIHADDVKSACIYRGDGSDETH